MKYLKSFNDIPSQVRRNSVVMLYPECNDPEIPFDKLPYNNESGQFFNYILDIRTGEMVLISKSFLELTGFDEAFFKQGSQALQEMIYPPDLDSVLRYISKVIEILLAFTFDELKQTTDNSAFRIQTRTGAVLNILRQRIAITVDKDGKLLYEAGMFLNVTRLRNDGNISAVFHGADGIPIFEYYPKEDAVPLISGARELITGIARLAGVPGNAFVRRTRNILSSQYTDKNFTVKTFSELLNISRSQLYRQFEKNLGICPNHLIRLYRLQQSLEHLARNELSISEVAWRAGFASPSWFAQCFYQEFDCTPSDYRHLMR